MSNTALFLATGIVVRKQGKNRLQQQYELLPTHGSKFFMTYEGKIIEFNISFQNTIKKYVFFEYEDLLERDKEKYNFKSLGGFCTEEKFTEYKNYSIGLNDFLQGDHWFDANFELAVLGDIISIEILDFSDPSKYYSQKTYTFNIEDLNIDFTDPSKYPINRIEDSSGSLNLLPSYSGKFYTKNIPLVNSLAEKEEYTRLLTLICFRISFLGDGILEILAMKSTSAIKDAFYQKYHNNNSTLYDQLEKIDQLIGGLLKDWGFVPGLEATYLFENKELKFVNKYFKSLIDFHNNLKLANENKYFPYDNEGNPKNFQGYNITHDNLQDDNGNVIHVSQDEKDEKDSERRILYLFNYLTTEGLSVFSYEQRLNLLKEIVKKSSIEQKPINDISQNNVIKLINTFVNSTESDQFLTYLLTAENNKNTNFEILYTKLDDGRLERYPVISWFVDEATNLKFFIYTIYNIWKISKYNPYYIPQGITSNESGLNPDAYFLNEGKKYYPKFDNEGKIKSGANPILGFSVQKIDDVPNPYFQVLSDGISYKPAGIKKEIITINSYEKGFYTLSSTQGSYTSTFEAGEKLYGEYHLFQPISLLGYEADLDLDIPNLVPIPAFLFYYAVNYDNLKDFDAAISFTIQITIDLALFYFTGGASTLKHLSYIKYITEINNVRKGLVAADTAVLFWRGIDVAGEVIAVTSGVLSAFFDYQANTSNNLQLVNLNKRLSYFFMALALGTAGGSVYTRNKTIKAADDVLKEVDHLTQFGISHNLPNDVLDILYTLRNVSNVSKTFFKNKLGTLTASELGETNHIQVLFDNLNDIDKQTFWMHFRNKVGDANQNPTNWGVDDIEFWKLLNKTEDGQSALRFHVWDNVTDDAFGKTLRRDINYLNDYVLFKSNHNQANWVHINEMIFNSNKYIGGHTQRNIIYSSGSEVGSGSFNGKWIVIDELPLPGTTNQNINSLSSFVTHSQGHIRYDRGVLYYRYNSLSGIRTDSFVLNGQLVKKVDTMKTIINPTWSESRIIQENVYAIYKKNLKSTNNNGLKYNMGYPQIEKEFETVFSDGTPIKLIWKNYQMQDGVVVTDYYYIEIQGF